MRVAHVITRLIVGGAQENTLLTAIGQQRDYGDDVALITGPGLGPEGSLVERAQEANIDVRLISASRRNIHPWRDWQSYRELIAHLREFQPEIVHTHSSKAGIFGRAAAAKLGLPAVHTVHGASFHFGQNRMAQRLYVAAETWAARRCAKLIGVCDAMTEHYVSAGIAPRQKFVTIYSGMEVEPFLEPQRPPVEVRRELGFTDDQIVVGKVGRLFHLKGHEFLIRAAPDIVRQHPQVRFLLVGDGILREPLESEIDRLGLRDHFVFTGLVPPERVPELIHAMDIVAHTSLWEGLARVLPQGLIAGKPVVSYDVDGACEVVLPGETGYLLPPQSVDELTAAIGELAGDAELRNRLGNAGRDRFTHQFRHETMTAQIRDVYRSVLNERSHSGVT